MQYAWEISRMGADDPYLYSQVADRQIRFKVTLHKY